VDVASVDQRDVDRRTAELADDVRAPETAADDDDSVTWSRRRSEVC
jgi:hypothetical protein